MKKIIFYLLFFILVKISYGDVVLTEVMYNPVKASDTDLEWVEIFNNGTESVNLSLWKIDGNNFDDFTILPKEFVVLARELIDGTDLDNDSFESVYGNNDGIWNNLDGNYRAFDADFSLTDLDTLNLTDGTYYEILQYNASFGGNSNGYTIEKIDVNKGNYFENWQQSKILDGTPGYNLNVVKEGTNKIDLVVEVSPSLPTIILFNISDDSQDLGFQVRPNVNNNKSIFASVVVNSTSGLNDVLKVKAELNGNEFLLFKEVELNNFSAVFSGNILMNYFDTPGFYKLNISAENKFNGSNSILVDFEYLSLLAISLDKSSLNFGKAEPGKLSNTEAIKIYNQGNVNVDLELFGNDLESGVNKINVGSIELGFDNLFTKLDYKPSLLDFNLITSLNSNKDLMMRLNLPLNTKPSVYSGSLSVVGIAG